MNYILCIIVKIIALEDKAGKRFGQPKFLSGRQSGRMS